jgi:trans-2,3-dihydro-3-hydroxyanthranilate isomerase
MPHQFVIADVFTDTPFGGNPLAVFPDARGLSDRAMQAVAREFNFAETTFVLPPQDPAHTRRVRIFTPTTEVPFAGHPNVGTAAVLVHRGLVDTRDGRATLIFDEGVGPVAVEVRTRGDAVTSRVTLERGAEVPSTRPSVPAAAATLSLPLDAVVDTWFATVGLPFCFIRIATQDAVDHAALDRAAWSAHFAAAWTSNLFFFAARGAAGDGLYARMFAPAYGIDEDPATGSACAALAGSLADTLPDTDGTFSWRIEQGVAMGRRSLIDASADKHAGRVVRVHVGGSTVMTGEGTMSVPPGF